MRSRRKASAGDIDFIAAVPDEFGSDTVLAFHITHSDGGAQGVAV